MLPPRSSADHVSGICAAMAGTAPAGAVDLAAALHRSRSFCQQRGFILCLSDFLEREDQSLAELAAFRAQGHDAFVLQILDPMEIELPRSGDYDFIDQESGQRLRAAAEPLHAAYQKRVLDWRTGLRRQAENAGLRWHSVSTEDSLTDTMQRWLP
jgi:uncharacterized protein (DUF58 family)